MGFERRFNWPATSTLAFIGILVLLLTLGLWPRIGGYPMAAGLPPEPGIVAAAERLHGQVSFPTDGLRFQSSLYGAVAMTGSSSTEMTRRIADAERALASAGPRMRRDARWQIARAAIDLARHDFRAAEAHYQRALARSERCSEARLGLGVTLAGAAVVDRSPLMSRRLMLRAIAQFAAVPADRPEYDAALYDRAVLLDRVGRADEAAEIASLYLERDATSVWAERIRAIARRGAA
jgi:tetratricopeptide (TPR) repeat protein